MRMLAEHLGQHVQGLHQATRGNIGLTSKQIKKIRQLEIAYNYCRHVTKPLIEEFVQDISMQLHSLPRDVDTSEPEDHTEDALVDESRAKETAAFDKEAEEERSERGTAEATGKDEKEHKAGKATERRRKAEKGSKAENATENKSYFEQDGSSRVGTKPGVRDLISETCTAYFDLFEHGEASEKADADTQTVTSLDNTLIFEDPGQFMSHMMASPAVEFLIGRVETAAIAALTETVGGIAAHLEEVTRGLTCRSEGDDSFDSEFGAAYGEPAAMVDECYRAEVTRTCFCLLRFRFAAMEYTDIHANCNDKYYCEAECWEMLEEDADSHNMYREAALNGIYMFGSLEPFLADITRCTRVEVRDAFLDMVFVEAMPKDVARELEGELMNSGGDDEHLVTRIICMFTARLLALA